MDRLGMVKRDWGIRALDRVECDSLVARRKIDRRDMEDAETLENLLSENAGNVRKITSK